MIIETLAAILGADPDVAAIVGDRIYPVTMPDAPTYDLIVLTKASGVGNYDLVGDVGVEGARVQVDCHSDKGASACIALKTAVRRALSGYRGGPTSSEPCAIQGIFCINDFDLTEPATERAGPRVRRRTLEFNIWSQEV